MRVRLPHWLQINTKMKTGILAKEKEGWTIHPLPDQSQHESSLTLHPDDVWKYLSTISLMVNWNGKEVEYYQEGGFARISL